MKNNNYLSGSKHLRETIQKIFSENGSHSIPDVNLICTLTHMDRKTVMEHLQEWWLKHDYLHQNDAFLYAIPEFSKSALEEVALLQNYLDSLIHELELHGASINYLPDIPYPFANYLIQAFLDIQNKLHILSMSIHQTESIKEALETQLWIKFDECAHLNERLQEISLSLKKKTATIKNDLQTTRREADALRSIVRSLKKNKKKGKMLGDFKN